MGCEIVDGKGLWYLHKHSLLLLLLLLLLLWRRWWWWQLIGNHEWGPVLHHLLGHCVRHLMLVLRRLDKHGPAWMHGKHHW